MPRNLRYAPKNKALKLGTLSSIKAKIPTLNVKRAKSINDDMTLRPNQGFYNSHDWKMLSANARQANPYCMHCGINSERLLVDHIVELSDNYGLRLEPSNLVVLCYSCHAIKTNDVKRARQPSNNYR